MLNVLIPSGLLAILVVGLAGAVTGIQRGARSAKWSFSALIICVAANYPVLEAANAKDPEAGPMGLFIIAVLAIISGLLIAIGIGLGGTGKLKPQAE